jgi:hypothetical protein
MRGKMCKRRKKTALWILLFFMMEHNIFSISLKMFVSPETRETTQRAEVNAVMARGPVSLPICAV